MRDGALGLGGIRSPLIFLLHRHIDVLLKILRELLCVDAVGQIDLPLATFLNQAHARRLNASAAGNCDRG